jgi:aminoacylase
MQDAALENFRAFLRIPTISGLGPASGAYDAAVAWLQNLVSSELKLPCVVLGVPGKPILLVSWIGSQPVLPCIILNSHYDVVPVMQEHWDVDAFAAVRSDDGRIYGRGAQDMKCVCIQYLEAIRRLQNGGWQPKRTVHLTFVPDEEVGGTEGMELLVDTPQWAALHPIGLLLDEGLANPRDAFTVFYGERMCWWLRVRAQGPTGHGSRFIEGTAMSKLIDVCNKALVFREEQQTELGHTGGCSHATAKTLGDVTTLNLTMLRGGVSVDDGATYALNVIPIEAEAGFDVRVSPQMDPAYMRSLLDDWCKADGLSWEFTVKPPAEEHYITSIDRTVNSLWGVFADTISEIGVAVEPEIFPAGTDSAVLRKLGVAALGFSPMRNTPILLHEHNEWLHEDVFLEGIAVYEKLIRALSDG